MRNFIIFLTLVFTLPAWSQAVSPADRSRTTSLRPTISAQLDGNVRNARIWVDGTEFTHYLTTRGNTVSLVPPYNLDMGIHRVQLATGNGRETNWSFAIVHNDAVYHGPRDVYYNQGSDPYYNQGTSPYYNQRTDSYDYRGTYPYNNQTNDPYYDSRNYPNDYPSSNSNIRIEDILPAILPAILRGSQND